MGHTKFMGLNVYNFWYYLNVDLNWTLIHTRTHLMGCGLSSGEGEPGKKK